jgi:protein-arginine deiminase
MRNHPAVGLVLAVAIGSMLVGCDSRPRVDLAADVDRDEIVDFDRDEAGEDNWTADRGAIFLNNNDSDDNSGAPDHADAVVNGPEDLADLAVLRLRQMPNLPPDSRLEVAVDDVARSHVQLFYRTEDGAYLSFGGDGPLEVGSTTEVSVAEALGPDASLLRDDDLELRIEASSYADASWSGEVLVTATVSTPDGEIGSDSVRLRVAPFLLLSNMDAGRTLYVREFPERNDVFLMQLEELVPTAGAELEVVPAGEPYPESNIWLQDTMEIGYSEMPGRRMNVVLKANRGRPFDELARDRLLGPDYGWLSCGSYRPELRDRERRNGWLDWYGNLEVSPAVPGYPLGRVYYGANGDESLNPQIVAMLDAQGIQAPAVRFDTGWLLIKHVDEIFAFVPGGSAEHPHMVLVPDTALMLELLEGWMAEGKGDLAVLQPYEEGATVATLLRDDDLVRHNRQLQTDRLDPNVATLQQEFGVRSEDIIRMPAMVTAEGTSLFPNMVNSVILNGHLFVSDPHGPEVEGRDLLQEYVRGILADLPLEVHFLDDRVYHAWSGNTHCATNVRREAAKGPWWSMKTDR